VDWPWDPFFSATAQVAVTAFAVLVATLQLGRSVWWGSALKLTVAAMSLLELLIPFLAAVIALMPSHPWRIGYWVMGGAGVAGLIVHAVIYLRHEEEADAFDEQQMHLGLPISLCVYSWILCATTGNESWSLYVVASLSVWLLFSGSFEACYLLSRGRPPEPVVVAPLRQLQSLVAEDSTADSVRTGGGVPMA
jgi:hypothetical protein